MDIRDIIKKLRHLGWRIELTGKGHVKAIPPNGGPFIIMANTPSDKRAGRNAISVLRRYGYRIT